MHTYVYLRICYKEVQFIIHFTLSTKIWMHRYIDLIWVCKTQLMHFEIIILKFTLNSGKQNNKSKEENYFIFTIYFNNKIMLMSKKRIKKISHRKE